MDIERTCPYDKFKAVKKNTPRKYSAAIVK